MMMIIASQKFFEHGFGFYYNIWEVRKSFDVSKMNAMADVSVQGYSAECPLRGCGCL